MVGHFRNLLVLFGIVFGLVLLHGYCLALLGIIWYCLPIASFGSFFGYFYYCITIFPRKNHFLNVGLAIACPIFLPILILKKCLCRNFNQELC